MKSSRPCRSNLVSRAVEEGSIVRFRCPTGHAHSAQTLVSGLSDAIDEHLWNAVRALEEKLTLLERTRTADFERIEHEIQRVQEHLDALRPLLSSPSGPSLVVATD